MTIALGFAAAALIITLAGCSSSSGLSSGADLIRTVDAIPNGGDATIDVNSGTVEGDQTFFTASPYLYINPGPSIFSFVLSTNPAIVYPTVDSTLVGNSHYTAVLTGRADISTATDPRYPQVLVLQDDQTVPPGGNERVRFINTAPDAGAVDVLVNGTALFSGVTYPAATAYVNVPSGTISVSIRQTGTTNIIVPATQVRVPAGGALSLFGTETAVSPTVTYGVSSVTDF
jgi:hypothetical protein